MHGASIQVKIHVKIAVKCCVPSVRGTRLIRHNSVLASGDPGNLGWKIFWSAFYPCTYLCLWVFVNVHSPQCPRTFTGFLWKTSITYMIWENNGPYLKLYTHDHRAFPSHLGLIHSVPHLCTLSLHRFEGPSESMKRKGNNHMFYWLSH